MTPPSRLAELYALTHRGNPGDVEFYRQLCAPAASVLELGAGSGRLLSALARPGRALFGLELDRAMLSLCRRRLARLPPRARSQLRLRLGDMRRFELEQRFERVLLPYNGFFCLLKQQDALDCLRSVRRVLAPGGVFALDVWNAEPFHDQAKLAEPDATPEPLFRVTLGRDRYEVFESTHVNRHRQRLDVSYYYLPDGRGKAAEMRIRQRYYLAHELQTLLARAGLRVVRRFGSFGGSPYSRRSRQLVLLADAA